MILRAALSLILPLAAFPASAADAPRRVPPDRAAMSQYIASPPESSGIDPSRGANPARKAKRVRYTIPAPKRM